MAAERVIVTKTARRSRSPDGKWDQQSQGPRLLRANPDPERGHHMLRAVAPHRSLPERTASDIRKAIRSGAYPPKGALPAEPILCAQLQVSRGTLRHAISILEEEGLVTRRQGSGTFVASQGLQLRSNLSTNFGVTDLIESAGWEAGSRSVSVTQQAADKQARGALHLDKDEHVVVLHRTRTADDRPVARTMDVVAIRLLISHGVAEVNIDDFVERNGSLYRALADLGIVVRDGVAEVMPAKADRRLAAELGVRVGALLLRLDQVDCGVSGEPILLSREYFVADTFKFQVYRKGKGERSFASLPAGTVQGDLGSFS